MSERRTPDQVRDEIAHERAALEHALDSLAGGARRAGVLGAALGCLVALGAVLRPLAGRRKRRRAARS